MGSTPKKISASRGAAALGLSKWASPLDTWLKIMQETHGEGWLIERGYEPIVREDKALFRWGHAFEDAVCRLAGNVKDGRASSIIDRERFYSHDDFDFVTCHIDGRYEQNIYEDGKPTGVLLGPLHEGKTVFERAFRDQWGESGTEQVKEEYMIQVQHQMACTGADECIISALVFPRSVEDWEKEGYIPEYTSRGYWMIRPPEIPESDEFELANYIRPIEWASTLREMGYFHQYPIRRNQTLIDLMLEKYELFWNDYVLTQTPPPAACYNDIKKLLTNPCGTIVASKEIERISALDKALADEIKSANKKRAEYKTLIGQYLKDNIEGAPIDDDSRAKVMLMSRDGHKLRSYSKKGGLR